MRKSVIILFTIFGLLMLSACTSNSMDAPRSTDEKVYSYRGENLTCHQVGSGQGATLSCNFERFYAAYPELLKGDLTIDEDAENVKWHNMGTDGSPKAVPCVGEGRGKAKRYSCDYPYYYALHPEELEGLPGAPKR